MVSNHVFLGQSQVRCQLHQSGLNQTQIGAQHSGSDLEKEEGDCGYEAFTAITQTVKAEWSRLLLTW